MTRSRITGEQIVDADVLSEAEHDAWVHRNLVCSGTITFEDDTETLMSGTGDIRCGGVYVDGSPITTSGYTGAIPVVSSVTTAGIATNLLLNFENGVLTSYSGTGQTQIEIPESTLSLG
jgi:hypothetical protein